MLLLSGVVWVKITVWRVEICLCGYSTMHVHNKRYLFFSYVFFFFFLSRTQVFYNNIFCSTFTDIKYSLMGPELSIFYELLLSCNPMRRFVAIYHIVLIQLCTLELWRKTPRFSFFCPSQFDEPTYQILISKFSRLSSTEKQCWMSKWV